MSGSSSRRMTGKTFTKMLIQKSRRQKGTSVTDCRTENERSSDQSSFSLNPKFEKRMVIRVTWMELRSGRQFFGSVERTAGM
jgi:hypothetical protein